MGQNREARSKPTPLQTFNTALSWDSAYSELIKPCIHHILTRKKVSTFGSCSGHVALVRTRVSHAAPQGKMLHHLVLVSFGTYQEFWNESRISTEVPLYLTKEARA